MKCCQNILEINISEALWSFPCVCVKAGSSQDTELVLCDHLGHCTSWFTCPTGLWLFLAFAPGPLPAPPSLRGAPALWWWAAPTAWRQCPASPSPLMMKVSPDCNICLHFYSQYVSVSPLEALTGRTFTCLFTCSWGGCVKPAEDQDSQQQHRGQALISQGPGRPSTLW